jgi:hypothetical protein
MDLYNRATRLVLRIRLPIPGGGKEILRERQRQRQRQRQRGGALKTLSSEGLACGLTWPDGTHVSQYGLPPHEQTNQSNVEEDVTD